MKTNIKKYFTTGLIAILILIILLQRSCNENHISHNGKETVITKIDTLWKHDTITLTKNVKLNKVIYVPTATSNLKPGEDLVTCKQNFDNLLKDHLKKSVYIDTLNIDSIGTVTIIDTVAMNKLYGKRRYIKNIMIPFVTKTVTIIKPADPVRQLYIGANLFGDRNKLQLFTPGIIYKTKKDHVYQVNVGVNFDGSITYGLGTYWKIKLK